MDRLVGYSESHEGTIFLSPNEVFSIFEFCTIGFYKEQYQTVSYPFKSGFNEPVYFRLNITKKEPINLRICQYYEAYIQPDFNNYRYSPVYIQLFREDTQKLVFEGCRRAIYSCKSASTIVFDVDVFEDIFEDLEPGRYFLKFNVEWLFPSKINEAILVSYTRSPLNITAVDNEEGIGWLM